MTAPMPIAVQDAVVAIQTEAQALIDASGDIATEAAPCDGAILIRPAVIQACASQQIPVCVSAAAAEPDGVFRFVDTAEDLWDVQELRPWTAPGPLAVAPSGMLTGARTVAFARHGNIVISVGFGTEDRGAAVLSVPEPGIAQGLFLGIGLIASIGAHRPRP